MRDWLLKPLIQLRNIACAPLAQRIELLTSDQAAGGSNPPGRAIFFRGLRHSPHPFFPTSFQTVANLRPLLWVLLPPFRIVKPVDGLSVTSGDEMPVDIDSHLWSAE